MATRSRVLLIGWVVCLFGPVLLFCAQTIAQAAAPRQSSAPTLATNPSPHAGTRAVHRRRRSERKSDVAPAPVSAPSPKPSSNVQFNDGRLTITATNCDLAEILRAISARGGMTVAGPVPAQHVFGVYGPGNPREVLTQLLTGFGYNYMLVGTGPGGMPRQLVLSLPSAETPSLASSHADSGSVAPNAFSPEVSGAPGAPTSQQTAETSQPSNGGADGGGNGEPLGPGAIANVPPNETQDAQDPSNTGTRVQQNMQRLEQMQEAQSGQQSAPQ